MPTHDVALLGREAVAEGTMLFRFSRPAGFEFRAGQSAHLSLPALPSGATNRHRIFSFASAPYEQDLAFATRMRDGSEFKQVLRTMPLGTQLRLKGPRGTMTLHKDAARPAVFIAGGIGITPFLSMARQAAHERTGRPILLLYSNRRPELAAFLDELRGLERTAAGFRLLARMTDTDGMLDAAAAKAFVGELRGPVYYLAGPPPMVNGMTALLREAGVPETDIRSEEFYGY